MQTTDPRAVRPEDWLDVMKREYVSSFVRHGGAAVKVVVPRDDEDRHSLIAGLRSSAEEHGFAFASVDAATTKLHLVDRLFHAVARQMPWHALASSLVRRLLAASGLEVTPQADGVDLAEVARVNGRDVRWLAQDVKRQLERELVGHPGMCQEFRFAMIELCLEAIGEGQLQPGVAEQWLCGELRLISAMKRALIFSKIHRHNARHMLLSLTQWLRLAGRSGLVLSLDITQYTARRAGAAQGTTLFYTRPAIMDGYEVVRQLIDSTDDALGCLTVVVAPPDFLSNESWGLDAYRALKLRVIDEVHDRYKPNPVSALVRISREAPPLGLAGQGGDRCDG